VAGGLQSYSSMRVRIIRRPTGAVDGISLHYYRAGLAYDLSPELAEYLVASGFASIEMRKSNRSARQPRNDRRSLRP